MEYWRVTIYQKNKSDVAKLWYGNNQDTGWRISYVSYLNNLRTNNEEDKIMKIPIITDEEILERSNNLKNGKAAGIDGVKGEVIKRMMKDKKVRNIWVSAINNFWNDKQIPVKWTESVTTMIPKKNKSKIPEHRPIAVTCVGSKLVLGYLRDKIEEHMEKWNFNHDNQFGFTKGGRIDYSLYLLQYITNQAYNKQTKYHKNLLFTFIDFSK